MNSTHMLGGLTRTRRSIRGAIFIGPLISLHVQSTRRESSEHFTRQNLVNGSSVLREIPEFLRSSLSASLNSQTELTPRDI